MNKIKKAALIAALAVCGTSSVYANANSNSSYVSMEGSFGHGGGGLYTFGTTTADYPSTSVFYNSTHTYKKTNGPGFNLAYGKYIGEGLRAEISVGHTYYTKSSYYLLDDSNIDASTTTTGSGLYTYLVDAYARSGLTAATLSAYYDLPVSETFVPYIGAGIGYGRVKNRYYESYTADTYTTTVTGYTYTAGTATVTSVNQSKNKLVYHGSAGMMFKIGNDLMLDLGYKFQSAGNTTLTTRTTATMKYKNSSHMEVIGIKYMF